MSKSILESISEQNTVLKPRDLTKGEDIGFANARQYTGLDKTSIKELADDIVERGLLYPLLVWERQPEPEDKKQEVLHVLIGGNRRVAALEFNWTRGKSTEYKEGVPCRLITGSRLDAKIAALADVLQRSDLDSFELAEEMARLRVEKELSGKALAERLHKSPAWVSTTLSAYTSASDPLKDAWRKRKVTMEQVIGISKLKPEEQEKAVVETIKAREDGTKSGKTKARALAAQKGGTKKKKTKHQEKASISDVRDLLEIMTTAPKKSHTPYVQGMLDGLRFAAGEIGWEEFKKEGLTAQKLGIAALEEAKEAAREKAA